MQKSFFLVIPFSPFEVEMATAEGKLKAPKITRLTEEDFQRSKSQLFQRVEFIILGLRGFGIEAMPLSNTELIELFWGLYHPSEAERGYYPDIPLELAGE